MYWILVIECKEAERANAAMPYICHYTMPSVYKSKYGT